MNKKSLALAVAAAAFFNSAQADTSSTTGDNIIVTATRTAQSADEALASVSVINRQQIEQLQPGDLLDLLSVAQGVDVSRSGGRGANASLYLRGSNNGHTLVMVDGVRQGSATLGEVSLQHIDPAMIERVEIVRGPRSSLYGSEALGGVIQIFTRRQSGDFKPIISLGYGSDNTRESSVDVGGSLGKTSLSLRASHIESDGMDNQIFDGNTDADDDAYRNTTLSASLAHQFDHGGELSLDYYQYQSHSEYDQGDSFFAVPDSAPYGENEVESFSAAYRLAVNEFWSTSLAFGRSADESLTLDDNTSTRNEFNTYRDQLSWQNDLQLNEQHLLTLGLDYYEDEVDSSQTYSESRRSNRALFAQWQGEINSRVDFVVGYRRDDNQQFGYETTYNAALGFDLNDEHRLIISHGTAFKAPTFNDLYWPADAWSAGNADLAPEESDSIEAELRGNYQSFSWTLTAYRNNIENLIEWAETSPFFWQPSNVSEAKIRGVEMALATQLGEWQLNAAASFVDPEDEATGNTLARRAKRSLSAQLDRDFGQWSLGLQWKLQGQRYDDAANDTRLSGYGVVGIRAGYEFTPQLRTQFRVDNLFGQDYQLSDDYYTEGTKVSLQLTYSL